MCDIENELCPNSSNCPYHFDTSKLSSTLELERIRSHYSSYDFEPKIFMAFSRADCRSVICALRHYERIPKPLQLRRIRRLIRYFENMLESDRYFRGVSKSDGVVATGDGGNSYVNDVPVC